MTSGHCHPCACRLTEPKTNGNAADTRTDVPCSEGDDPFLQRDVVPSRTGLVFVSYFYFLFLPEDKNINLI